MSTTQQQQWVSIADAAEILGTSTKTVRRRIADGTIPARRMGRLIRVNLADLELVGRPVQYIEGAS